MSKMYQITQIEFSTKYVYVPNIVRFWMGLVNQLIFSQRLEFMNILSTGKYS